MGGNKLLTLGGGSFCSEIGFLNFLYVHLDLKFIHLELGMTPLDWYGHLLSYNLSGSHFESVSRGGASGRKDSSVSSLRNELFPPHTNV